MNYKINILTLLFLLSISASFAQENNMNRLVKLSFNQEPLEDILSQLRQKYGIQFSYGNNHINTAQLVSFYSEGKSLKTSLEEFFEENNIRCLTRGNQLMLKPNEDKITKRYYRQQQKKKRLEKREKIDQQTLDRETLFDLDLYSEITNTTDKTTTHSELATTKIDPVIVTSLEQNTINTAALETTYEEYIPQTDTQPYKTHIAQFSVIPKLSTNRGNFDRTHIFSFNLFWGINGGIKGIEIGGIGNIIKGDVKGAQIAGIFNTIEGNLEGIQLASLFNRTNNVVLGTQVAGLWNLGKSIKGGQISGLVNMSQDLTGIQASGLCNFANDIRGAQVAGLLNFANGKLYGGQIAGLGNIAWGDDRAIQIAGLFNKSIKAQVQISGLVNLAKDVQGAQIGLINTTKKLTGAQIGLINTSKKAKGLLIGLINVTDSLQGFSFGLINIVRKNGYNRFEIAGGDAMYANIGFKFGPKYMYHIVQAGWTMNSSNEHSWSIGLGLGSMIPINDRLHLNTELVSSHLSEGEAFTARLNLLNQFKLTLDIKLSKKISFFVGPTFNALISNRYNETTQTYGSDIMHYTFFNKTYYKNTNLKMWVGATAGFRF